MSAYIYICAKLFCFTKFHSSMSLLVGILTILANKPIIHCLYLVSCIPVSLQNQHFERSKIKLTISIIILRCRVDELFLHFPAVSLLSHTNVQNKDYNTPFSKRPQRLITCTLKYFRLLYTRHKTLILTGSTRTLEVFYH